TPSTPYTSLGATGWNQYDVLTSPGDVDGDRRPEPGDEAQPAEPAAAGASSGGGAPWADRWRGKIRDRRSDFGG
ncbi:hypothetical protein ABZ855_46975, partial [Streptomyces sp. NPDC047042]